MSRFSEIFVNFLLSIPLYYLALLGAGTLGYGRIGKVLTVLVADMLYNIGTRFDNEEE